MGTAVNQLLPSLVLCLGALSVAASDWDRSGGIEVSASSAHPVRPVIHIIDGSGISGEAGEFHSNEVAGQMWVSGLLAGTAASLVDSASRCDRRVGDPFSPLTFRPSARNPMTASLDRASSRSYRVHRWPRRRSRMGRASRSPGRLLISLDTHRTHSPQYLSDPRLTVEDVATHRFQSETGKSYTLEFSVLLVPDDWTPIGAVLTGNGDIMTMFDRTGASARKAYRIVISP